MSVRRVASKYGAKKTQVDGITFDSKAEAARYTELKMLERAGQISKLELQPTYELAPSVILGGRKKPALRYRADFRYTDHLGNVIVEDVKGVRTAEYQIKRHLMKFVHGIDITEISRR